MESIFRPAFVLMSGRAVGFIAAFAIPVVLARVFDRSAFGTYKQLFLVYSTLYSVAQLGMAESLFYFLPAASKFGGRYVFNAVLVLAIAGAACFAALWGARASIAQWLNNGALAPYLPLIGAYLMLMLMSAVLEIAMIARKRHVQACVTYALSDALRALLLIAPALWFGRLDGLLFGAIVFAFLRLGATLASVRREYAGGLALDAESMRTHLAYAAPFSIYVLIEVVQTNLHLYVVSNRFDAATFAVYAVGCLSIPLVDFLTSSAGNVMMVRMREHLLHGANRSVLTIWRDTTRKLLLVFAPLVGGLLVVAPELIITLFTRRYEASVPVFMIWTTAILFSALLTDSVLRVYAQMRFLMLLGVIKVVVIAATINGFIAAFGVGGAVLAVLLTIAVGKVLALGRIKAVLGCRLAEFLPWRSLAGITAVSAGAALAALAVKSTLVMSDLPRLLVCGVIYAATYLVLLWQCRLLSDEEKLAITRRLLKPRTVRPEA